MCDLTNNGKILFFGYIYWLSRITNVLGFCAYSDTVVLQIDTKYTIVSLKCKKTRIVNYKETLIRKKPEIIERQEKDYTEEIQISATRQEFPFESLQTRKMQSLVKNAIPPTTLKDVHRLPMLNARLSRIS